MVSPPNKTKPKPPQNPTHTKWLYLGTDFLRRAEEDRRRALICYDPEEPHLVHDCHVQPPHLLRLRVLLLRLPEKC